MHESHRGGGSKETAAPTPDDLRLEAIKHQILTKLGLRSRPDVNRTLATVPRHLALETLSRAEAQSSRYPERSRNDHENEYSGEFLYGGDEYSYRNLDQQEDTSADENARIGYREHEDQYTQEEMDDFYARTSEIITFAEPGESHLFFFSPSCNLRPTIPKYWEPQPRRVDACHVFLTPYAGAARRGAVDSVTPRDKILRNCSLIPPTIPEFRFITRCSDRTSIEKILVYAWRTDSSGQSDPPRGIDSNIDA